MKKHPEVTHTPCPTCHYDDHNLECECECPFPRNGIDIKSECDDSDSYHVKWVRSKTPHGKSIYAKEIYKIPLRIKV